MKNLHDLQEGQGQVSKPFDGPEDERRVRTNNPSDETAG